MFTQNAINVHLKSKQTYPETHSSPVPSLSPTTHHACSPFPPQCPLRRRCACASLLPVLPHTPWPLERLGHWNAFALGTPWHTIPHHTIPHHTIPYHAKPHHTIPYHTTPSNPTSLCMCLLVACLVTHALALGTPLHWARLGTPYHTIPYHTTPHHTIPYNAIPHHTTPHHTTPSNPSLSPSHSTPLPDPPHSTQYMQTAGPTQMPAEGTALTSLK